MPTQLVTNVFGWSLLSLAVLSAVFELFTTVFIIGCMLIDYVDSSGPNSNQWVMRVSRVIVAFSKRIDEVFYRDNTNHRMNQSPHLWSTVLSIDTWQAFLDYRSRTVTLITTAAFSLHSILSRPMQADTHIIRGRNEDSVMIAVVLGLPHFVFASTILIRSWQMWVRFKYRVQLKNVGWIRLVSTMITGDDSASYSSDSSQNRNHGAEKSIFWIRYKSILASGKTVVVGCLLLSIIVSVLGLSAGSFTNARRVFSMTMFSFPVISAVFLCAVPESDGFEKMELSIAVSLYILTWVSYSVFIIVFADNRRTTKTAIVGLCVSQTLSLLMYLHLFYFMPYYFITHGCRNPKNPFSLKRQSSNAIKRPSLQPCPSESMAQRDGVISNSSTPIPNLPPLERTPSGMPLVFRERGQSQTSLSKMRLFSELNNTEKLSDLLADCLEEGSVENGIAILECLEWKRLVRIKCDDDSDKVYERGIRVLRTVFEMYELPPKHDCDWDLMFHPSSVSLRKLGAQSAIVDDNNNNNKDLLSKARLLFDKYFSKDAPLEVNISGRTRLLTGRILAHLNASIDDDSDDGANDVDHCALCLLFDLAISQVCDNLYDSLLRSQSKLNLK